MCHRHWLALPCSLMLIWTLTFSTSGVNAALAQTACGGWRVVSSPSPGPAANDLYGVSALSSKDAWTVGEYGPPGGGVNTLTEHWDGTQWSVIPSPTVGQGNYLYSVSAVSNRDVWAVGVRNAYTLIEHWDGSQWSVVPSSNPGPSVDYLYGVSATSSQEVWAVGEYSSPNGGAPTLIEKWNGKKWQQVPSPSPGAFANILYGVAALSSRDAWAVGEYLPTPSAAYTLTEHWNGRMWKVVPSPSPGPDHLLRAVSQVPGTSQAWAVGFYSNSESQTLVEAYC